MLKFKSSFSHELFRQFSNEQLISVYRQGPDRIQYALQGLGEKELLAFPVPEKWNILEIVIHTAHSEISGAMRIRQTITQSSRLYSYYDQDIWTKQLVRDAGQGVEDLNDHVLLFGLLRKTTTAIFNKATEDDWDKLGFHQEAGPMNLRQLLELYADHSERHIDQILQRRSLLDVPLVMNTILPERLY